MSAPDPSAAIALLDALPTLQRHCPCVARQGVYLGWDGRLVKIGMATGKDGIAQRMRPYRTCNPMFRLLAVLPMPAATATEIESVEHRLHARFADSIFRVDGRRGETEWFYPADAVTFFVGAVARFHERIDRERDERQDRPAADAVWSTGESSSFLRVVVPPTNADRQDFLERALRRVPGKPFAALDGAS